ISISIGARRRLARGTYGLQACPRPIYEGASAMAKRQKRVFILGGGAALGAHHVGALKLLEERGIVPDTIIGSSIGCINACCYGSGGVGRRAMAGGAVSPL